MVQALRTFTSARAAFESTRGDNATPVRLIYAEDFITEQTLRTIRPEELRASYEGFFSAAAGVETNTFSMKGRLSFNQAALFGNLFFGPLLTGAGGAADKTYTFPISNTADNVKTWAVQLGDAQAISASVPGTSLKYLHGLDPQLPLGEERRRGGAVHRRVRVGQQRDPDHRLHRRRPVGHRPDDVELGRDHGLPRCLDDRLHRRHERRVGRLHARPQPDPLLRAQRLQRRHRRLPAEPPGLDRDDRALVHQRHRVGHLRVQGRAQGADPDRRAGPGRRHLPPDARPVRRLHRTGPGARRTASSPRRSPSSPSTTPASRVPWPMWS